MRILDTRPAVVRVVDRFPARSALLAGDRIVAVDGTALVAAAAGERPVEVIGRVPERTYLYAALAPPG